MSGQRIIDGLKEALAGDFARVTIDGQTWTRGETWRDISSAPFRQTVLLARAGEKLCVTAYRIGAVAGWRHAHTSDQICFVATHWQPLPEPPVTS